jgi:transcriptional regulator with XRE-family HTH domain
METMGDRIARRRKETGLRQQQIADKLGIVRQTVSLWENGHTHDMHGRHLRDLAKILGVEPDWILYGDSDRNRTVTIKNDQDDEDLCAKLKRMTEEERRQVAEYIDGLEEEQRKLYLKLKERFER